MASHPIRSSELPMEPAGRISPVSAREDAVVKDRKIAAELKALSRADSDYWTFRRGAVRRGAQGLTQYPAMMVPPMQAALLGVAAKVDREVRSVLDPFCGAGTTLVECMRRGLNYSGQDVNPLAILLCRVKAGPFHVQRLETSAALVVERAVGDHGLKLEADFPGLGKWFTRSAAIQLSRIRRAIRREPHEWCRRVFWTALAETVRLSSNSRTSTFKLHVRNAVDLRTRTIDVIRIFTEVLSEIAIRLRDEASALQQAGHLSSNGYYRGEVHVNLADTASNLPNIWPSGYDLLVTSPPYGDNTSTVPYGQYSYLPLQWIDLGDIDTTASSDCLASTYEIDHRSLGGSRKHALRDAGEVLARVPSLALTLSRLADVPVDRRSRVAAFCRDLDRCLDLVLKVLRPHAYMIWTVGNRRVGGRPVPTDAILSELLESRGARCVTRIERRIPTKRMATRNNVASTMRGESVLVFRKE